MEIILDSLTTTIDFGLPAVTNALLGAPDPNNANLSASSNSSGYVLAHEQVSPVCNDVTAKPFCLPVNNTAVYPGESYYVTWNPSYFGPNSTLNIMLNLSNDTSRNVWSSGPISSVIGVTSVALKQDLPLEDTAYNLTFFAQQFDTATGISLAMYDGPVVQLKAKPSFRYDPPTPASAKEEPGVKIGVPVCLGGLAIIAVGLFYGIRKRKSNRKGWSRGYGIRKSRWQRLGRRGRSKEDEITLQERELLRMEDYTDHAPPAARNSPSMDSLEHLVPAPIEENESAHKEENERNKRDQRR